MGTVDRLAWALSNVTLVTPDQWRPVIERAQQGARPLALTNPERLALRRLILQQPAGTVVDGVEIDGISEILR